MFDTSPKPNRYRKWWPNTNTLNFDKMSDDGVYLAVELTTDHYQTGCVTIPVGERAIVKAGPQVGTGLYLLLFRRKTRDTLDEFDLVDSPIRMVPGSSFKPIGRLTA